MADEERGFDDEERRFWRQHTWSDLKGKVTKLCRPTLAWYGESPKVSFQRVFATFSALLFLDSLVLGNLTRCLLHAKLEGFQNPRLGLHTSTDELDGTYLIGRIVLQTMGSSSQSHPLYLLMCVLVDLLLVIAYAWLVFSMSSVNRRIPYLVQRLILADQFVGICLHLFYLITENPFFLETTRDGELAISVTIGSTCHSIPFSDCAKVFVRLVWVLLAILVISWRVWFIYTIKVFLKAPWDTWIARTRRLIYKKYRGPSDLAGRRVSLLPTHLPAASYNDRNDYQLLLGRNLRAQF